MANDPNDDEMKASMPKKKEPLNRVLRRLVNHWNSIPIKAYQDGEWRSLLLSEIKDENIVARWIVGNVLKPFFEAEVIPRQVQFTIDGKKTPVINLDQLGILMDGWSLDLTFECSACSHVQVVHLRLRRESLILLLEAMKEKCDPS